MTPTLDPREEIADVAGRIEGLAASRSGVLNITLELFARRLHVALLLGERLSKANKTSSG